MVNLLLPRFLVSVIQLHCDSGSVEEGMCMPMMMGDECVNHCPVYCPMDQMMCPGGMDYNGDSLKNDRFRVLNLLTSSISLQGCPHPDYCTMSTVPSWTNGEECPAHCPPTCGQDEQYCGGGSGPDGILLLIT